MAVDREAIFSALFCLAQGITWPVDPAQPDGESRTFKLVSRRIRLFAELDSDSQQPYLGQAEHNEKASQVSNLPYMWVLNAQWIIYHCDGNDDEAIPAITNNLILAAVEAALAPKTVDPGFFDERNTLSGLVYHCYIDGEIFKDPGDIDKQAMVIVPIKILVP